MIGQIVGNHRVIEKIGDGGMGSVYLARHVLTDLPAAVKVLHPHHLDDSETRMRFFREARAAMAMRHPGIVRVFDCGVHDDGSAYIVMEFLEGEDLSKRIRGGRRMPIATAMLVCRQVVQALQAAHDHGIVHRDLKPDNLFMTPDPEAPGGERVKILDFGVAKVVSEHESALHRTQTGAVMGTPTYMSPEQCRGTGVLDHRADLYAVGCILFRLMCGRIVFRAKGYGELLAAHIHVDPPRPRSIEPAIPPLFEDIILKLLEKDPADRYQSAAALLDAMDDAVANTHLGLSAPEVDVPELRRAPTNDDTRIFTPDDRRGRGSVPEEPPTSGDWIHVVDSEPRLDLDERAESITPTKLAVPVAPRVPVPPSAVPPVVAERDTGRVSRGARPARTRPPSASGETPVPRTLHVAAESAAQRPASRDAVPVRDEGEASGISTTLRAASGDMSASEPARARRRIARPLVGVLAALAVAAIAFVVVGRGGWPRDVLRAGDRPATEPAEVLIRIESTPPGAAVIRPEDHARLGKTPYEFSRRPVPGEIQFLLELDGYDSIFVTLPTDRRNIAHVALQRPRDYADAGASDADE